ncbi:hypothetical protein NEHOM01_0124 [Nematocida homosporus]|uniref:uncharacterized protein n=1 Tax=Nematocida homosporus TaxID=1912981 RepID=UPI00221EC16B|nr:uncharacterized protein NEHOM01_0124 [Nematocida homosporus]KAI5184379.1 hypothetical protein NEHOM01_0124 [Nematocida homosporus]
MPARGADGQPVTKIAEIPREFEEIEGAFDIDNIQLIDYGLKDDELFKNLKMSSDGSIDDLDENKIYENELAMSEDEIERIRGPGRKSHVRGGVGLSEMDTQTNRILSLNSDVGNDICKENLRKIHFYLDEDEKREKALEEEISRTLGYLQQNRTK